jgi:hypothetical protein
MSGLRKIVDESDARAYLASVAKSGEPRRVWARRHGIDPRSLRAWDMNRARRSAPRARGAIAKLVELVPAQRARTPRRYTVRVGALAVEVSDDFDADTLRRLVEVLRSC